MAAYLIVMQQVHDIDRYREEYLPGLRPFLRKHGAEGEPPNSTVVLRFADAATAWGLLNDPDYQPVKEIRFSITSRGQAVIAPEFSPTDSAAR